MGATAGIARGGGLLTKTAAFNYTKGATAKSYRRTVVSHKKKVSFDCDMVNTSSRSSRIVVSVFASCTAPPLHRLVHHMTNHRLPTTTDLQSTLRTVLVRDLTHAAQVSQILFQFTTLLVGDGQARNTCLVQYNFARLRERDYDRW